MKKIRNGEKIIQKRSFIKSRYFILLLFSSIAACQSSTSTNEMASLILINGKVWTSDRQQPEVEVFAVKDKQIIAIGTTTDMLNYQGDQMEVIDAKINPV